MDREKLLDLLSDLTAPPRGRDNYREQREALADYLLSLERRLEALERLHPKLWDEPRKKSPDPGVW